MVFQYALRYCYSFERGYDTAYSLLDVVLYEEKEEDEQLPEQVQEYLTNEDSLCDLEEKHKIFFLVRRFELPTRITKKQNFLMAALYPAIEDEGNVINLVLYPIEAHWDNLDEESGRAPVLQTVLTEAETAQDFPYKVVDACNFVVRVATDDDDDEATDDDEAAGPSNLI